MWSHFHLMSDKWVGFTELNSFNTYDKHTNTTDERTYKILRKDSTSVEIVLHIKEWHLLYCYGYPSTHGNS
jgi:hypothetical protein